jgi:acyl carrier protein
MTTALSPDEVLGVLRDAVATVLERDPESLSGATRFTEDLAADSLAVVEIVEILEEELTARTGRPFRIEDEDLDDLGTLDDAVRAAVRRLRV